MSNCLDGETLKKPVWGSSSGTRPLVTSPMISSSRLPSSTISASSCVNFLSRSSTSLRSSERSVTNSCRTSSTVLRRFASTCSTPYLQACMAARYSSLFFLAFSR